MERNYKVFIKERWFLRTDVLSFITSLVSLVIVIGLVFLMSSCGGGGAGSADTSQGVSKLTPNLFLYADKMVARTGNIITLQAVLYDGNGKPLSNKDILFDIVNGSTSLSSSSAKTNSKGVAQVYLSSISTSSNVAVVRASYNSSAQDTKTVYFVDTETLKPALYLIPDGDNDGVYGESSDYVIKSDGGSISLKAVYMNIAEQPEPGVEILFGSDSEYVLFSKNPAITDYNGVAYTTMSISIIPKEQTITVYAYNTNNGTADIISMNVIPVTVGSIYLTSSTYTVETGKTVEIEACLFSTNGFPMPDGTIIRYYLSPYNIGSIEEIFGYTVDGCHRTVFTAGSNSGNVTITASSEGVSGSINITVVKLVSQLQVYPQTATTSVGTPFKFIITGGTAPYIVIVNTTSATVSPSTISQEKGVFTVISSVVETVTITVIDDQGQTATATLNVI